MNTVTHIVDPQAVKVERGYIYAPADPVPFPPPAEPCDTHGATECLGFITGAGWCCQDGGQ